MIDLQYKLQDHKVPHLKLSTAKLISIRERVKRVSILKIKKDFLGRIQIIKTKRTENSHESCA